MGTNKEAFGSMTVYSLQESDTSYFDPEKKGTDLSKVPVDVLVGVIKHTIRMNHRWWCGDIPDLSHKKLF